MFTSIHRQAKTKQTNKTLLHLYNHIKYWIFISSTLIFNHYKNQKQFSDWTTTLFLIAMRDYLKQTNEHIIILKSALKSASLWQPELLEEHKTLMNN